MKTVIKHLLMVLIVVTSLMCSNARAQTDADAIIGKWTNDDKTRVLEFVKTGNYYEAIIKEAPDKSLLGKKQITGLQYTKDTYKGIVHLPKRGKTLPCTLSLKKDGTMYLSAKAGFVSQSQIWTRVK